MLLGKTAKFETYHSTNNRIRVEYGEIINIYNNINILI